MWEYLKNLFNDYILVALSAIWGTLVALLFPNTAYMTAAGAVLVIMLVDLVTKLFALSRQGGGFLKALRSRKISSAKFLKGTGEKFLILIVMLIVGACAYRISPIAELATWFMQVIYTLMFLRDVLSIVENLSDAGVNGLGPFKRIFKKKLDDYCESQSGQTDDDNKDS